MKTQYLRKAKYIIIVKIRIKFRIDIFNAKVMEDFFHAKMIRRERTFLVREGESSFALSEFSNSDITNQNKFLFFTLMFCSFDCTYHPQANYKKMFEY